MNLRSTDSMSVEALQSKGSSFKNTEVGRVPTDWEVVCLREVANFGGGTTPPRKNFEKFYASGTHPWVKTLDLNNGYISSTEENVTEAAFSETSLKMHPIGTVLVAMYGGFNQIGRTGLIKVSAAINQALVAVITKKERLVPTYLLYYLNYKVDYWKTVASSSRKDPNITSNDVKNFILPLPSVIEQTAIANALSDVDALIQELEKLIAKKQAIKTATMQQLLTGRTRLPQFAHHPDGRKKGYKPSELGEIPEDWEVVCLGDLATIKTGSRNNQDKEANGAYPFFVRSETVERLNTFSYDCEAILVPGEGGIGSIFHYIHGKFDAHQRVYVIRNFQNCSGKFVYLQMRQNFGAHAMENSVKATVDSLRLPTFQNFTLLLPSVEEQDEVARILWDMDEEVKALGLRLAKTRQIKQGMMQELLTGKTRLVKPAGVAE
ncbi:restriction endonuclease subunit S [Vibrio cholerae]|uniref:restriction endonuclease subunit S n=1 Tax=Vibrio cholerae TaxID=666 RepID=UPI0011D64F17|nr:restriction endonuclease subunit S [Vibrio cholerae]MDV2357094.1 restriction endonuclease subunit S [Vibrio cholerae]TXY88733.1 restriction endonuclease subunit S [Vibrio cholerae]GIC14956.1 restriction endonuclease subunit S [Vibrio cholerae]HDL8944149.1 restriction endonuclease subunit S [Vibrio cholerae]